MELLGGTPPFTYDMSYTKLVKKDEMDKTSKGKNKSRKKRKLGIWSNRRSLQLADGRTGGVRFYNNVISGLIASLGGKVSIQQKMIIDDIAYLELRTRMMKEEYLAGKGDHPESDKYFLAWVNSERRLLESLGMKAIPGNVIDLQTYVNNKYGDDE